MPGQSGAGRGDGVGSIVRAERLVADSRGAGLIGGIGEPGTGDQAVIRTPDRRLRVFVSSTLGELAEERRAVSRAVSALRLTLLRRRSTGRTWRRPMCSSACIGSGTVSWSPGSGSRGWRRSSSCRAGSPGCCMSRRRRPIASRAWLVHAIRGCLGRCGDQRPVPDRTGSSVSVHGVDRRHVGDCEELCRQVLPGFGAGRALRRPGRAALRLGWPPRAKARTSLSSGPGTWLTCAPRTATAWSPKTSWCRQSESWHGVPRH